MFKKLIIALFFVVTSISWAQQGTTSPFSFYGIGTLKFKGTIENRSMGGISVFSDSIHLNILNPAGVAGLKMVNYTAGASHKLSIQQTEDEKENSTTTSLDYLAIGIPMGKFGASFGLIPYTSVGYKLESTTETSVTQWTGEGGLNKAFLALGYQVTPKFNIGVDVNYNFGTIENVAYSQTEDIQYASREYNRSELLGFSFNVGAQYRTMISQRLELFTSATYTPETDFTSQNFKEKATIFVTQLGGQAEIDKRDIPVEDTDFSFPSQYTLGAGIGQPHKWFIGAEYSNYKTSNYSNRTFDLEDVEFTNASKYRLGGFFIPKYNSFTSYFSRVVYRAGIRFEESGVTVAGEAIDEFGISFGVGLPVGRYFSNINIGFELGRQGTKNNGLIQENFFNTFISLSLNDKWFEKRYYD